MKALLRKIRQILRDRRTRRFLTRFVGSFSALVVFVTTYALILPAITMESEAACGIEAHQHDDSCYTEDLICGQEESEEHHHTSSCYEKVLICGKEVHTHSAECYKADSGSETAAVAATGNTRAAAAEALPQDTEMFTVSADSVTASGDGDTFDGSDASGSNDANAADAAAGLTSDDKVEDDTYATVTADDRDEADTADENKNIDRTGSSAGNEDTKDDNNATDAESKHTASENANVEDTSVQGADVNTEDTGTDGKEEKSDSFSTGFAAFEDENAGDSYIPEKDALVFESVLNKRTGIYCHHTADDEDAENSSAVSDWVRVDEDTELAPSDLIRIYLSYTLPKDTVNATNDIARYRLPDTIHLTDAQIEAINTCENGISGQFINYETLEVLDTDRHSAYLGLEAIEGTRCPDEELTGDDAQEFISATVKAEKVYDQDSGEYVGTDLVFTFSPYTVDKNAHAYDSKGQPTRAGEEVSGWLTLDFNMEQIDWAEDHTSEIVFAEEDDENDIRGIKAILKLAASTETAADDSTTADAEEAADLDKTAEKAAEETAEEKAEEAAAADTAKAADKENKVEKDKKEDVTAGEYPAAVFEDTLTVKSGRLETDLSDTELPGKTKLTVHVEADEGTFPEGTKMVLSAVEDLDAVAEAVGTAVDAKTRGFQAVDITFYDKDPSTEDAKEIEPLKPIRVSIKSDEIKKAAEDSSTAPVVVHIEADNTAKEIETRKVGTTEADTTKDETAGAGATEAAAAVSNEKNTIGETADDAIHFEADSFSVYAVVYTVDFHWEVDGKAYDYSINGGETIGLKELLPLLNVVKDDEETEDNEVLDFINNIETAEFSDESLVKVAKITDDITVGKLIESLELQPEYSADLTEEDIDGMNSRKLTAPDWALISLKAFDSAETLTITMSNAEVFVIKVTDARDELGLSGRTNSIITVSYGSTVALIQQNGNSVTTTGTTVTNESGTNISDIYSNANTTLYSQQTDTAWTFEYDQTSKGYYVKNQGKYLTIVNGTLSYVDEDSKSPIYISKNREIDKETEKLDTAGNTIYSYTYTPWDGTYLISDKPVYDKNEDTGKLTPNTDVHYLNVNGGLAVNAAKANASRLVLCLPENPAAQTRKASLIYAGDLSDGETTLVYKKIWNSTTDEFDYYAVDINGKLVKVWESSDSIYWMKQGNSFPDIEWKLREGTNEDGSPSGYLFLTQEKDGVTYYLCPQHDGTVVRTLTDDNENRVGISLPGRNDKTEASLISAWDYDANTTYGMVVEKNPSTGAIQEDVGVKPLLESQEFQFAVRDPRVQGQLTTVDTLDTMNSSDKNIKITMFNFAGNEGYPDNKGESYWGRYSSDRLAYMTKVIGSAGWASGVYNPNLMKQVLGEDGYPVPANTDYTSLKTIFEPNGTQEYNYHLQDGPTEANHLFIQSVYDTTGYYYYSGFDNFAKLEGNNFVVYEQLGTPYNQGITDGEPTHPENFFYYRGNFLPYNELDTNNPGLNYFEGGDERKELADDDPRKSEDLYQVQYKDGNSADYYFGMTMEYKFQQGPNGLSERGDPMVFEFTGDDDLWVYVDDVLLMDIGGIHDAFHGKINFKTGRITIDRQNTTTPPTGFHTEGSQFVSTIQEQFKSAGILPNKQPWTEEGAKAFFTQGSGDEGTFLDYTTHDLNMFYMERGKGASNLQIEFNLPVIKSDQFQVSKLMPETSQGNPIQAKYADAAFYYEAYITENSNERKVTYAEFKDRARYTDGTAVIWKEALNPDGTVQTDGNGDVIYTDKFEIKPGQTAVFPVNDKNVSYRVVEVEPENDSHMLDNFNVSIMNGHQSVNDPRESTTATVRQRGQVTFENRPADDLVNELQIVKNLHGNLYPDSVAEETGSRYFEYKVYLETADGKMKPYELGEYYQIDGETGQYVYYDPDKPGSDKRCLAAYDESTGQYTYTYTNKPTEVTDTPKITEHTSANGSIGDIRPGDKIIIKGLMEGTSFIVDERLDRSNMTATTEGDWSNKYYFSGTDVENAYQAGDEVPAQTGTLFDPADETGLVVSPHAARGTILAGKDKDALVTVHNEVNGSIPLQKQWPEESDDFHIADLTSGENGAEITFTLERFALKKLKTDFTIKALVTGCDDYDQKYIIKDQNGHEVYTIPYSQMDQESGFKSKTVSLPVGSYTVERSADPVEYTADHNETLQSYPFEVTADGENLTANPAEAYFESNYTIQSRQITVTKTLENYNSNEYEPFTATYSLVTPEGLQVTDLSGNTVAPVTISTPDNFNSDTAVINFGNLRPGSYVVRESINPSSFSSNELYSMDNLPHSSYISVDVSEEDKTIAFNSVYTRINTANKVPVRVYWQQSGDYDNGHTNRQLRESGNFYPGEVINISWDRYAENGSNLRYTLNDGASWTYLQPISGKNGIITESINVTVPANGLSMLFVDGNGDPKPGAVRITKVSSGSAGSGQNATGTNGTTANPMLMTGKSSALNATTLRGAGNTAQRNDTGTITNQANDPVLTSNRGEKYVKDDWTMTVTLKKAGSDANQYLILDQDGEVIGNFTQEGSYWKANITSMSLMNEDDEPYYYYIGSINEEHVPDGMKPTIVSETDGSKYMYSKEDQDNQTGRILTVTNDLIKAYGDISLTKVDQEGTALPDAEFALYRTFRNGTVSDPLQDQNGLIKAVSTAEGAVSFTHVPAGTWYLKEIKAPEGFKLSTKVYKVVIAIKESQEHEDNPETETTVTLVNSDTPVTELVNTPITYGEVEFNKTSIYGDPVDGAVFTLYSDAACSEVVKIDGQNVTAESANGGKVKLTASRTIQGETVTGIETGDYFMKETGTPDGYKPGNRKYFVHIGDGKDGDTSFIAIAEENPDTGSQTLEQYYRNQAVTAVENEPNELPVEKIWNGDDSFIPSSITVVLQRKVGSVDWEDTDKTITLTASEDPAQNWKGSFRGLKSQDSSGNAILYRVREEGVGGWTTASITNNDGTALPNGQTIVIRNTRNTPEPGNARVQKKWEVNGQIVDAPDDDDAVQVKLVRYKAQPAADPSLVRVYVFSNANYTYREEITINQSNTAKFGFERKQVANPWNTSQMLDTSNMVKAYVFTEDPTSAGWGPVNNPTAYGGFSTTNIEEISVDNDGKENVWVVLTYESSGTSYTLDQIIGNIEDKSDGSSSGSSIGAYIEDGIVESVTLNSSNSWQYEFTDLPSEETDASGTKWFYRYAIEEVTTGSWFTTSTVGNTDPIDLENGGTANVVPDGGLVTITNSKTNQTTDLTAEKKWENSDGPVTNPADTVDYAVTFQLLQKESDTELTPSIVTGTPASGDTGWEVVGTYTVSNAAASGKASEGSREATFNSWGVLLENLVTEETTVHGGKKYYQYRIVETKVLKKGQEQDLEIYNVQYGLNGTTVTMNNTLANEYGVELPEAGGSGTRIFTILGSLLAVTAGAGILLLRRRRMF